jgi:dihydrofolate reductase
MKKISIYLHTSLDGFVAGPNGEMDWINVSDEMFNDVGRFTEKADLYLMGRVTWQMMEGYWPTAGQQPGASKHDVEHAAWYNKVPKVLLSRTLKDQQLPNTTIISDNVAEEVKKLKQQPGGNIIIFGSPSAAHTLMQHDLIDEYGLFVNPVLLGEGIPVFKNIDQRRPLKLQESKTFSSGVNFSLYVRA